MSGGYGSMAARNSFSKLSKLQPQAGGCTWKVGGNLWSTHTSEVNSAMVMLDPSRYTRCFPLGSTQSARPVTYQLTGGTDLVQDMLSDCLEAHHSPHIRHKGAVPCDGLDLVQKESVVDQHSLQVGGTPKELCEAFESDFGASRCDGLHSWGTVENVGDVTQVALGPEGGIVDRNRNIVHLIGWEETRKRIHIHITHFSAAKKVCVCVCLCASVCT